MNISNPCSLIFLMLLTATLAMVPRALADNIDPDADVPDFTTLDPGPSSPVLEIPQQCDPNSVALLCDHCSDDSALSSNANAATANVDANDANALASNPDLGGVYDYANQNTTNEASAIGTMNVPLGVYVPRYGGYPGLAPSPTIVSSGPGGYQQWASGPGSYQQWAPGPGYLQPMPLGYRPFGLTSNFGPRPFGAMGGGRFGR